MTSNDDPIDLLDIHGVADALGVEPATVRGYRSRGILPEPDTTLGGSPVWRRSTIEHWRRTRPGQGHRTDLDAD